MRHTLIRSARAGLLAAAATIGATPALAQAQDPAATLQAQMRVLASNPDDFNALVAAGNAAVDVGDLNAAAGLFGRADEQAKGRPEPQAGMGRVMANLGDPGPALGYFQEAERRGAIVYTFAVDRGLAKDLLGDTRGAQADYRLALGRADDAKARRRLALSLAIDGERTAALAFLEPLIKAGDAGARQTRAFVLALTGDLDGARGAIEREMPGASASMAPFFQKLPIISNAQKAAAVHLGMFPETSEIQLAERRAPVAAPVTAPRVTPPPAPAAKREEPRRDKKRDARKVEPKVERNLEVSYEPVKTPALKVDYEPLERAQTAPAPVKVAEVAVPPARTMDLPSEQMQRQPSATAPATGQAGERLASIDQLLSQPAPAATTTAPPPAPQPKVETPPPSRPKYEAKPQPKVEAAKPAPKPKPAPPKPDIGTEGTWWIQLAGGSRADAMGREWKRISGEAGSLLSGQKPHVTQGKDYFRLLVGPFSSRDKAQDLTNKLRGNGIDVFTWQRSPAALKINPL